MILCTILRDRFHYAGEPYSRCKEYGAVDAVIKQLRIENAAAVIGPPCSAGSAIVPEVGSCSCKESVPSEVGLLGTLARRRNVPLYGYLSAAQFLENRRAFPTLTMTTSVTSRLFAHGIAAFLTDFGWAKVSFEGADSECRRE